MPGLRASRPPGVRRLQLEPPQADATPLRALRRAHRVARPPLRRVRGQTTGVQARSGGCRVRRPCPANRRGLEGAGPPTTRRVGGRARGRNGRSAGGRMPRMCPRRSGPALEAWRSRRRAAGARARRGVGIAGRAAARSHVRLPSPARPDATGTPPKRRLVLPGARALSRAGLSRRRCLYDWSHRRCGCVSTAESRGAQGRDRDLRSGDPAPLR